MLVIINVVYYLYIPKMLLVSGGKDRLPLSCTINILCLLKAIGLQV